MQGNQSHPLAPARRAAVLLSATVVLAFALPSFAQADSAGVQYKDALPTATGKKKQKNGSGDNSNSGSGGQDNGSGSSGGSSGGGTGSGGQGGSGSSGSSSTGADSGASAASGGAAAGAGATGAAAGSDSLGLAKPANASYETSSKDGGSSPLSIVLIAIAVLAAISAAVVILRSRHKRQQGDALDPPPYAG